MSSYEERILTLHDSMAAGRRNLPAQRLGASLASLPDDANPDEEARLLDLSRRSAIPVEALREPAVVRKAERAIRMYENPPDRLAEQSPATAVWLSNPDNARLAHDDIPSLAQKEADASTLGAVKVFFTEDIPNIATSYGARMGAQIEQGAGGILRYIGERAEQLDPGRKSSLTKAGADLYAEGKAIMEVVEREKPLTTRGGKILGGVTDSVGAMLPAVGAGLVTLNPGVGLGMMGLTTAGQSFGEKREAGKSFGTSLKSALWQGGTEVATETIPFLKLAKWLKPGKMSRKVAEYLAAEVPGELIATALQNPADLYFDEEDPAKAREKVVSYLASREFVQDEIDTLLTTVAQGFIMGAPFGAGRMGSAAYEKRRAKTQQAALDTLLSPEDSKLAARAPEAYGDAVQQFAEAHGVGTVYLQADRMVEVLQEQGLSTPEIVAWAQDKGISQEALDTALVTGSAVELRVGDVAAKQAADPYLKLFQKDWQVDPASPSESAVDGAVQVDVAAKEWMAELAAQETAASVEGSEQKVYEDVLGQLTAAGRDPVAADQEATLWQARYRTRAQRLGVDPWELYQERKVEIVGAEEAQAAGLPQPGERPAIVTLVGNELGEFGDDFKALRKAAADWYKKNLQKTYAKNPELGEVYFSGKGLREFIHYGGDPNKIKQIVAVREIIEKGRKTESRPVEKPRRDGLVAFHDISADVLLEGKLYHATVLVGEDANGKLFYDLFPDAEARKKRREGDQRTKVWPDTAPEDGGTTLDQSIPPDDDGINLRIISREEGKEARRGYIRIGPNGEIRIGLLKKANLSTFVHETGHAWLEELRADAARENAPEQLRNDFALISKHLGIERLAAGEAIPAEAHEKFARTGEAYLMEGKAPSAELQGPFARFRSWLARIYREIRTLGVELTPEVREVLDRLVATDEEIAAARGDALQGPLLDETTLAEHASPEESSRYRTAAGEAAAQATENLDGHRLSGRGKRLEEWRRWAEETVSNDRLRKAIDELAAGPGIDRDSLRKLLGDDGMGSVPENADAGLWRVGGLDIEHAAAQAGYEDPRRFVENVVAAGTREEAIDRLVEAQEDGWNERYGAQEAIRTSAARRQAEMESRILARAASGEPGTIKPKAGERFQAVSWEALKVWAEQKIQRESLSDAIGLHKLLLASRRLRREAMAAAKKKNWEAAFLANERSRLNEALIAEHYRAQKAFRRMRDDWKAAIKTDIASEYRDQLNRVLMKYGLTQRQLPIAEEAPSLATFFADAAADADEIGVVSSFAAPVWLVDGDPREISGMTWLEVNELHETISWLVGRGREEQKATLAEDGRTVEEAIAAAMEESRGLQKIPPPKDTSLVHRPRQLKERYFAGLDKLPRLMKWMDGFQNIRKGGKAGTNERLILNPILKGLGEKYRDLERLHKALEPHIQQLQASAKKHPGELTHAPMPERLSRYGKPWTFERVVALGLNMGTQENRDRITAGYWLREGDMDQVVSILTEADWRAIEGIHAAIGTMFPQIAQVHAKINHFPLKKVRGMKFSVRTAEGTLVDVTGGYYPLRYDGDILRKIGEWTEKDELLNRHAGVLQTPRAKKGFTEARRKNVVLPVKLSLSVLSEHLEDVTTYAHLALPVRDADRVTRDAEYMERAEDVMGKEKADQIRPALKDILRREGRRMSAVEEMISTSRRLTSLYYIGWNFWTAAQNLVNLFPVLMVGGRKVFADGIMDVYSRPREAHREILAKSTYMAQRSDALDREMVGKLRNFRPGVEIKGVSLEDVRDASYALMKATDTMFAMPLWQGAYNEGLRLYQGEEARAILHADDKVRSVFGSGLTVDMARIQRDPGLMSLLTQFATFFMTQQQLVANSYQAMKAAKITKRQFAYDYAMVMVFPSLASTVLFSLVTKAEPPELDEIFGDLWSYAFGGLPGIRDLVPSAQAIFGKSRRPPAGVRIAAAEIAKDIQKLGADALSADGDKVLWDLAKLASFISGVPATRIYERWKKGAKQDLPQNVLIPARE